MREPAVLTIRLARAAQLYNALDPAPFRERDLDPAADTYLFEWAEDLGARPYRLVIVLPEAEAATPPAQAVPEAVRHHFAARHASAQRRLRAELRRGRTSLVIGLVFLVICLGARQVLPLALDGPAGAMLAEGLLILGWVAMWGPLEVFLYGWWPISGTARVLGHLAEMRVEIAAGPEKPI